MDLKTQTQAFTDKMLMPVFTWVIIPFLEISPIFQASVLSAYGMFGVYMQYNQEKLNDFIKILKDNPWVFAEEIVETEEFKDWFLIIMESYLKERSEQKRKIIKDIFIWFTNVSKEEKEEFELERILDILSRITVSELDFLKHLVDDLYPLQKKYIDYHILDSWYYTPNIKLEMPLTKFINFSNTEQCIQGVTFIDPSNYPQYYDVQNLTKYNYLVNGLSSLSILFPKSKDLDFSSTWEISNDYDFTEIWENFIRYILEDEET